MALHEIMTMALTHPLQVLCIGMVVARGVHGAVSATRETWRLRHTDAGSRLAPALDRDDLRFTDFDGRPTAAEVTAAWTTM
jgi:hypothetical protein